jgi:membrane protease YdiL (CAAX protease family)
MQIPPVQFDIPPVASVEIEESPLPRLPWIWVAIIVLFSFMIVTSLAQNDAKEKPAKPSVEKIEERSLEMQLSMRGMIPKTEGAPPMFKSEIDKLLTKAKTSSSAQKLRVVLRSEDNQDPFKDDLRNLAKSPDKENQAFAKLYGDPKPNKQESLALLKQVKIDELSEKLANVQVRESFGDTEIRSKTFDSSRFIGVALMSLFGLGGMVVGCGLWIYYYTQRQVGRLAPLGMPMQNIPWWKADRLAFAALIVFSSFIISQIVAQYLVNYLPRGSALLLYLPTFVAMGVCLKVPIFGWRITPKAIGLQTEGLPKNIGWAFSAFFANIPVMLAVVAVTSILSQFLPGGSHPISEELTKNVTSLKIFQIFLMACVFAPIWEEFLFRGLLFPAFSKATGKPIYGALISSFCFAAIHPQGALGILPLVTVAMMLCGVSYQTKSLTANMILHGLHNCATLLFALAFAPIIS